MMLEELQRRNYAQTTISSYIRIVKDFSRRYSRRWKIEGLFAWLHNFRRIVIRREYYAEKSLGMVQLACAGL
jgi:transposase